MRYSNELKVGLALLFSVILFFVGVRYFQDLPLFRGNYDLYTLLDDAGGVLPGGSVRISGVNVGSIQDIFFDEESQRVRLTFDVDEAIAVPEGSTVSISGISALGTAFVDIQMGPPTNAALPPGSLVPGREGADLLGSLSDQAPALVGQLDGTLTEIEVLLQNANTLVDGPQGDVQATLAAFRATAGSLNTLLRAQQDRLGTTLDNVSALSAELGTLASEQGDSLGVAVENLNEVLTQLNRNLAALETTTTSLDALLVKIDQGEGTIGLMLNDPGLYHELDSVATNLNALLVDLQANPRRYLRELRLVDIF
ncbi:MAG: MlaD family protein [Bacteroidota bacterium]